MHKMGQVCAPHPMPQPLTQPSHAPPTKVMRNRAHWLRRRKHDTGEWNVAGTHDAGEDTMSAGAQDGSVLCTTPMPHLLTQPSHALPTKPIAQQYLLAGTKEARHGREACCGRHNPEEKGRLVMGGGHSYAPCICHHTVTQPSHALSQNAICPTVLTGCDERTITREGNQWRGDITQERKECQQVHTMGQFCAPHPGLISSRNRCMHGRQR